MKDLTILWSLGKGMGTGTAWLAAITIDEHTLIPFGSAAVILIVIWRAATVVQKHKDQIEDNARRIHELERQLHERE